MDRRPPQQYAEDVDMIHYRRKDGQRILCTGSRNWTDRELIMNCIINVKGFIDYIIHGNNGYDENGRSLDQIENDFLAVRGADKLAGQCAELLRIPVLRFIPDWNTHELTAGPMRNTQMIKGGYPTYAFIFHDDIGRSKGSKDMIRQLELAKINYEIVSHK